MTDIFEKLRHRRLLLIDDDEWVRDSLRLFFESEGCHIVTLETAEEGLDLIENQAFDIIIADYRLPGMNGFEFIRSLARTQNNPLIILITAYGSEEIYEQAKSIGVHACIPKPFTSDSIEASLKRLI